MQKGINQEYYEQICEILVSFLDYFNPSNPKMSDDLFQAIDYLNFTSDLFNGFCGSQFSDFKSKIIKDMSDIVEKIDQIIKAFDGAAENLSFGVTNATGILETALSGSINSGSASSATTPKKSGNTSPISTQSSSASSASTPKKTENTSPIPTQTGSGSGIKSPYWFNYSAAVIAARIWSGEIPAGFGDARKRYLEDRLGASKAAEVQKELNKLASGGNKGGTTTPSTTTTQKSTGGNSGKTTTTTTQKDTGGKTTKNGSNSELVKKIKEKEAALEKAEIEKKKAQAAAEEAKDKENKAKTELQEAEKRKTRAEAEKEKAQQKAEKLEKEKASAQQKTEKLEKEKASAQQKTEQLEKENEELRKKLENIDRPSEVKPQPEPTPEPTPKPATQQPTQNYQNNNNNNNTQTTTPTVEVGEPEQVTPQQQPAETPTTPAETPKPNPDTPAEELPNPNASGDTGTDTGSSSKSSGSSVVPIAVGLGAAVAGGLGVKAIHDHRKNSKFDDQNEDSVTNGNRFWTDEDPNVVHTEQDLFNDGSELSDTSYQATENSTGDTWSIEDNEIEDNNSFDLLSESN